MLVSPTSTPFSSMPRKALSVVFWIALVPSLVTANTVRDGNGGNCVGVQSCRPRCVSFTLDRSRTDCAARHGIFADAEGQNPWDLDRFRAFNCEPAGTCFNDQCGQSLDQDVTVRVGEEGEIGSYYFTDFFLPVGTDQFTYCSVYPCHNQECALPEQMVSVSFCLISYRFIYSCVVMARPMMHLFDDRLNMLFLSQRTIRCIALCFMVSFHRGLSSSSNCWLGTLAYRKWLPPFLCW